jgi:hypothetical protein
VDGFPQYQVSCPISPGNSGGPVLDERGRVIGIVSWTKSDAQSVSFAIPAREVERLHLAKQASTWEQLSLRARPSIAPHRVDADWSVSSQGAKASSGGFNDLADRLAKSVGRKVTVVVQEDGAEHKFSFTVPNQPLKK